MPEDVIALGVNGIQKILHSKMCGRGVIEDMTEAGDFGRHERLVTVDNMENKKIIGREKQRWFASRNCNYHKWTL